MAMTLSADYITRARASQISRLAEIFGRYYRIIAGGDEPASLAYNPPAEPLTLLLDQARRHDEAAGHTSVGPHRDDLDMMIASMPARRIASQGQCKTFTIALRLAQYEFLREAGGGIRPLLLLDDIFDKLDADRVERIMEITKLDHIGQIFVTDTNRDHLDEIMSRMGGDYRLWEVDHGSFTPIHAPQS
jgi:DNA replication and repair protein RecF